MCTWPLMSIYMATDVRSHASVASLISLTIVNYAFPIIKFI